VQKRRRNSARRTVGGGDGGGGGGGGGGARPDAKPETKPEANPTRREHLRRLRDLAERRGARTARFARLDSRRADCSDTDDNDDNETRQRPGPGSCCACATTSANGRGEKTVVRERGTRKQKHDTGMAKAAMVPAALPAQTSAEQRYDDDGELYSKADFVDYYGGKSEWNRAKHAAPLATGKTARNRGRETMRAGETGQGGGSGKGDDGSARGGGGRLLPKTKTPFASSSSCCSDASLTLPLSAPKNRACPTTTLRGVPLLRKHVEKAAIHGNGAGKSTAQPAITSAAVPTCQSMPPAPIAAHSLPAAVITALRPPLAKTRGSSRSSSRSESKSSESCPKPTLASIAHLD